MPQPVLPAQPAQPDVRAVGVHVAVQQRRGLERGDQAAQPFEPAVRQVVAVTDATWRRVRQQHVDPAAVPLPAPPRPASQHPGAPGLLPVGVLVLAGCPLVVYARTFLCG